MYPQYETIIFQLHFFIGTNYQMVSVKENTCKGFKEYFAGIDT